MVTSKLKVIRSLVKNKVHPRRENPGYAYEQNCIDSAVGGLAGCDAKYYY